MGHISQRHMVRHTLVQVIAVIITVGLAGLAASLGATGAGVVLNVGFAMVASGVVFTVFTVVAGVAAGAVVAVGVVGIIDTLASVDAVNSGVAIIAGFAIGTVATVGWVDTGTVMGAIPYLVHVLLIPVLNASFDHLSVQVSRLLLTDLVKHDGPWQWLAVAGHLIGDIFFALVFLFGLAILLPLSLDIANLGLAALGSLGVN